MTFIFLDMAGRVLFVRDDAERAQWTQEEMTLDADFPYIDGKVISIGQRVYFRDPSTGAQQVYEIKNAKTLEPDHYQQITGEHICISELSDEHIEKAEYTKISASNALTKALKGTQWSVGAVNVNPNSSCDISRGSVWQAVLVIKENWNVLIVPRVTVSSSGQITRKLDILPPEGVWHGLRLSVDKNLLDPSVTYDDTEVYTALYAYGGTTVPTKKGEEEKEVDIADVVWAKTAGHPAKPKGQKYLEDPDATAKYGRNGRARFGFFQNTEITDAQVLIEKTWETLKTISKPSISIEGTVADLYRLGYADEPIRLHDIALVEVLPAGYKASIQIIRMTTDLLDPSSTTVTIGAYIPNIIYINRDTNTAATGSRGGGGNKSKQTERSEYETAIAKNNRMIQLRAYQNDLDDLDGDVKLQEARITVEHNRITSEVTDRRNADNILNSSITQTAGKIEAEVTRATTAEGALSSRLTITEKDITLEVERAKGEEGKLSSKIQVNEDNITLEVERATGEEGKLSSRIQVNEDNITLEVERATGEEGKLSSRIQVNEDNITLEVERAKGEEGSLSSRIEVNEGNIALKVSKDKVISSINISPETIDINASKINLTGYVTASDLEATNAKISNLTSGSTTASSLKTQLLSASTGFTYQGHSCSFKSVTIDGTSYHFVGY